MIYWERRHGLKNIHVTVNISFFEKQLNLRILAVDNLFVTNGITINFMKWYSNIT